MPLYGVYACIKRRSGGASSLDSCYTHLTPIFDEEYDVFLQKWLLNSFGMYVPPMTCYRLPGALGLREDAGGGGQGAQLHAGWHRGERDGGAHRGARGAPAAALLGDHRPHGAAHRGSALRST